jgi:lysine-N-methylase
MMLMPTYVSRFSCIGGECEDTCCAGWGVTLDKDTFHHYQASFDPVLRPLFTKYVKRYAHSKADHDYGHIELQRDACQSCGLLSEKKLCRIHERLGEEALSNTCAYYPRTVHHLGDLHQVVLTLSCPEAARLALLAEDAFGFVGEERTFSLDYISQVQPRHGLTLVAMDDVRTLLFQILRSPDITLSNRLKVIGHYCDRVTDLIQKQQLSALPEFLSSLERELESGAAMSPLAGLTEQPEVQAQISTAMFMAFLTARKQSQTPHVRQVLGEVAKGLGIQEGVPMDGPALIRAYEMGLDRLAPAMAAVPWLLDHYMCNETLRELFPWGQENPRQHYATVVIQYSIVRLLLAGRAAARETLLTPAELAETVQVACRHYHHDAHFTKHALDGLVEAGWDSLERLHALL